MVKLCFLTHWLLKYICPPLMPFCIKIKQFLDRVLVRNASHAFYWNEHSR